VIDLSALRLSAATVNERVRQAEADITRNPCVKRTVASPWGKNTT